MIVTSCTQRETDIGRNALQSAPEDTFLVIQGVGTVGTEWAPNISNGRGSSLQVGEAGGFSAFFAMRFDPLEVVPESSRVENMVVYLTRNRIWPEEGAPELRVTVREIGERWIEDSLLAGYLPGRGTYPIIDSLLLLANEDTLIIPVPESLWSRWLAGDSTTWGLLVEPRSPGVLVDFYSSEKFDTSGSQGPSLEIRGWKPPTDSIGSDTVLLVKQVAEHDAYLAVESETVEPGRLALSQGRSQRGAMYFPLDSIAEINFARVVNHAELYLYADTAHSANLLYANVGLLYKDGTMANRDWITNPDSARAGLVATSSSSFNADNTVITFDVSSTVAYWVANPDSNTGFQVLTSEESGHLTRQVFHNCASEIENLRPRLVLWLTEQQ